MTILDRNDEILRRTQRLEPIGVQIRETLERGKREQLLAGRDATGDPFAPLAASTLRYRVGTGPPLAPKGASSAIVVRYAVTITTESGRLTAAASWPGLDWVRYHRTGTRKMPKRDPGGFRAEDSARCLEIFKGYVMGGGVRASARIEAHESRQHADHKSSTGVIRRTAARRRISSQRATSATTSPLTSPYRRPDSTKSMNAAVSAASCHSANVTGSLLASSMGRSFRFGRAARAEM